MSKDRRLVIKSYISSLPKHINGEEKVNALTYFAQGAGLAGDNAEITYSQIYEPCDVGVIIGNAFASNPDKVRLPHYKVRKMVIDTQTQMKKYWLSIDTQ